MSTTFALPIYATVGHLEAELDSLAKPDGLDGDLTVDMRQCEFIEPASLILLVATLRAHQRRGSSIQLMLPESADVRDFFRIWRFPQALGYALGRSFRSLVHPDGYQYFGERVGDVGTMRYAGRVISSDQGRERLLPTDFFGIRTIVPQHSPLAHSIATDECERWNQQHIQSVLRAHFGTHGGRIGSHVIHEALMNALRHPEANIIQTVSSFDREAKQPESKGAFTLVVWDDGEGMVATLSHAIDQGLPIRSGAYPTLTATYEVVVEDEEGEKRPPVQVRSDQDPQTSTPLDVRLLSCLFPGITRDVRGVGHRVHEAVSREDPQFAQPGMGLYILANTVIDVLGGQLSLRTGHLFLNLKRGSSGADYRAKIKRFGPWHPPISGNMLTARVPIPRT